MNIGKVAQAAYYEQAGKEKVKDNGRDFKEDFLGSLNDKMTGSLDDFSSNYENVSLQSKDISENEYLYGISSRINISATRTTVSGAVTECDVRGISYAESDHVKICIEKGYVYKAQVDKEKESVYVEEKNDNGSVKGYEVNPKEINEDTEDELEEFSLTAWRKALSAYVDYVQDRIENGPEKFQIGSSEFSIEEWDKLMEKIDKDIDAVKEEQKERLEKEEVKVQEEELREKIENSAKTSQRSEQIVNQKINGEKLGKWYLLADDNGIITYNGVTFVLDSEKQQLCLGDMSQKDNILSIPLSGGGTLNVNRDNIDDLGKAIGMFSPEDINRILRAISEDAQCRRKLNEIEDDKNSLSDEDNSGEDVERLRMI